MPKKTNYINILHRMGLLDASRLAAAQELAKSAGIRVREAIVRLGYATYEQIAQALAERYSLQYIDPRDLAISVAVLPELAELIPESVARDNLVLPFQGEGETLRVVVCDPKNEAIPKLREVLNRPIEPVLSTEEAIREAIDRYYGKEPQLTKMPRFYYDDENGTKCGPITFEQVQILANRGVIVAETPLETEGGHKGLAGQLPGLKFPTAPPAPVSPTSPPSAPDHPKPLFCTNCGNPASESAVACMSCGAKPLGHKKFCRHCGIALNPEQIICTRCGAGVKTNIVSQLVTGSVPASKNKVTAGILGILLGGLGAHKFYMGSWGWGLLFLANPFLFTPFTLFLSFISLGLLSPLFMVSLFLACAQGLCGLIEGIMYLVMSDGDFAAKYPPGTQGAFRW